MKNKLLLRTNLILCVILVVGFVSASMIIYQSNIGEFREYVERIANLTSDGIYYQGVSYFAEPINTAMAMANNSMLKRFLAEEPEEPDEGYLTEIKNHLNAYTGQYTYVSSFLVSTKSNRYYHFSGQHRTLERGDPANAWYYGFLERADVYSFDAGTDQYEGNMYFIDCKIYDDDGDVIGVIGVGFQLDSLHQLTSRYVEAYDVAAILIGARDTSKIAAPENAAMFSAFKYADEAFLTSVIAGTGQERKAFWGEDLRSDCYMVSQYVPELQCYLIVENDMSRLREPFEQQLFIGITAAALIAFAIILIFNKVISTYNQRLLRSAVSLETQNQQEMLNGILNGMEALICVCDAETFEILFLNDAIKDNFGLTGDCTGQFCYKTLQRLDTPCPTCPYRELHENPDKALVWEHHERIKGSVLRKTAKLIDWADGRKAHLEYAIDITALRKAQESLEQRDAMLNALNKAAIVLLAQEQEDFIESMSKGVNLITTLSDIDRVSVSRNFTQPDGLYASQVFRWNKASGASIVPLDELKANSYDRHIPRWRDVLAAGGYINGPVRLMPEAEALKAFGCLSALAIPVFHQNQFWGFVLFENLTNEREFTADEVDILRSAGLMLATVIMRNDEASKTRAAEKYTRLMLDAAPLGCVLWDQEFNTVDCNNAIVELLGFKSKKDCLAGFANASPEYQADGRHSYTTVPIMLKKALDEGVCLFDWIHKSVDGTPIPVAVTAVRVEHGESTIIATYMRDLREHNSMMNEIEYRNTLLNTVNRISVMLLQSSSSDFERNLIQAMGVMAEAVGADRSYIWENYINDGELYCYQTYEWSEGAEPQQGKELIQGVSYREVLPSWEEAFLQKRCINGIVRELSPSEFDLLTEQGIISIMVVPIYLQDKFWGFVGFDDCHRERVFSANEESILRSASELIASALIRNDMEKDIKYLENEADKIYYDPLTGIYSRRYLDEQLKKIFPTLSRAGSMFSVMMIDIDYFKKYNDTYGHGEGDTCLITVANTLKSSVTRSNDFVARYGGEEFIVVLPNTDEEGAKMLAGKMLENIRNCAIPHEKNDVAGCVTVSIGVVTGRAEYPIEAGDYIRQADKMLYLSKQNGRNRYTFAWLHDQTVTESEKDTNSGHANTLAATLAGITKQPVLTAGKPDKAAELIAETGCRELKTSRVGIWLLDEAVNALRSMTYFDMPTGSHAVQNDFDLADRAQYISYLRAERLLVIPDISQPNPLNDIKEEYGPNICAMLDAPIRVGGELAGVVCIEQDRCDAYPDGRKWTVEEQNFASSLADFMALAITSKTGFVSEQQTGRRKSDCGPDTE